MKVYGLIGNPLGHSFSKQYFTEKFEREQLPGCRFELYPIENIDQFTSLLNSEADLNGLAVTIPYKEAVIPFLNVVLSFCEKSIAKRMSLNALFMRS